MKLMIASFKMKTEKQRAEDKRFTKAKKNVRETKNILLKIIFERLHIYYLSQITEERKEIYRKEIIVV